jgi:type IV pilus assembly protein PilF
MVKATAKKISPLLRILICLIAILSSGCVTQSFEDNEPVVKTQANRDEMAATRVSLGLGYLKMGDMSQAKLNLEKAKRFSPDLVQVHTAFAHYYETVGEGNLAIASFEEALAIKSDSADTLNNYGVFLCRQNQVDAAEIQFLKAIAVPSYLLVAQSYENLASCYLQNDNFEKAEMYLNKTIAHSPNRTSPLLQMVRLKYAKGNYKEARVYLQKFERNTQRFSADSLALSYKVYRKLGQRRTANNYGNMLVKMYPQSWEGKQFILNGLEFIEADNLADKYQLSQKQKNLPMVSDNNKRVVKLSPKSTNTGVSLNTVNNTVNNKVASNNVKNKTINSRNIANSQAAVDNKIIANTEVSSNAVASVATASNIVNIDDTVNVLPDVENKALINAETNRQLAAVKPERLRIANDVSTETVTAVPIIESTSTQPVPAKRDVPLPEALAVATEIALSEVITNTKLNVSTQPKSLKKVDVTSTNMAFHKVIAGENLYNISVKYNTKISSLRKWNNISEKNTIRINQKIYVVDPNTVKKINE